MRIWTLLHPLMVNIGRRTLVNPRRRLTPDDKPHQPIGAVHAALVQALWFCGYANVLVDLTRDHTAANRPVRADPHHLL
jgi:hypothetical protein